MEYGDRTTHSHGSFHVPEKNAMKESNPELQDNKKNVIKVMKGLPKNYFQHCFQVWQG